MPRFEVIHHCYDYDICRQVYVYRIYYVPEYIHALYVPVLSLLTLITWLLRLEELIIHAGLTYHNMTYESLHMYILGIHGYIPGIYW